MTTNEFQYRQMLPVVLSNSFCAPHFFPPCVISMPQARLASDNGNQESKLSLQDSIKSGRYVGLESDLTPQRSEIGLIYHDPTCCTPTPRTFRHAGSALLPGKMLLCTSKDNILTPHSFSPDNQQFSRPVLMFQQGESYSALQNSPSIQLGNDTSKSMAHPGLFQRPEGAQRSGRGSNNLAARQFPDKQISPVMFDQGENYSQRAIQLGNGLDRTTKAHPATGSRPEGAPRQRRGNRSTRLYQEQLFLIQEHLEQAQLSRMSKLALRQEPSSWEAAVTSWSDESLLAVYQKQQFNSVMSGDALMIDNQRGTNGCNS